MDLRVNHSIARTVLNRPELNQLSPLCDYRCCLAIRANVLGQWKREATNVCLGRTCHELCVMAKQPALRRKALAIAVLRSLADSGRPQAFGACRVKTKDILLQVAQRPGARKAQTPQKLKPKSQKTAKAEHPGCQPKAESRQKLLNSNMAPPTLSQVQSKHLRHPLRRHLQAEMPRQMRLPRLYASGKLAGCGGQVALSKSTSGCIQRPSLMSWSPTVISCQEAVISVARSHDYRTVQVLSYSIAANQKHILTRCTT